MEYACRNSKNEGALNIKLGDLNMQVRSPGKDEIIHYASIQWVHVNKRSDGFFSIDLRTIDKSSYTFSNRYFHTSGDVEDKSASYAMFVRVLHMHLRQKSKAKITCLKNVYIPEWQKLLLVVILFGISYLLDFLGFKLFHPAIHGVALSGIALLIVMISEKNRMIEAYPKGEIPHEFLPG
jgi:hypothetical protein